MNTARCNILSAKWSTCVIHLATESNLVNENYLQQKRWQKVIFCNDFRRTKNQLMDNVGRVDKVQITWIAGETRWEKPLIYLFPGPSHVTNATRISIARLTFPTIRTGPTAASRSSSVTSAASSAMSNTTWNVTRHKCTAVRYGHWINFTLFTFNGVRRNSPFCLRVLWRKFRLLVSFSTTFSRQMALRWLKY